MLTVTFSRRPARRQCGAPAAVGDALSLPRVHARRARSSVRCLMARSIVPVMDLGIKPSLWSSTGLGRRRVLRRFLLVGAWLAATCSAALPQNSTEFPTRPVKILVPFAAGGPTDVVARVLADLLSARWGGQSVVIENRPGAGTIVATAAVGKAPPDG